MGRKVTLSTCTLNQWAMDFEGNTRRIVQSIRQSHAQGAAYRVGPELEVSGYGCGDHYYENDTILHCFEVLADLLQLEETKTMICDIGMPVMHKNVRYNCRVIFMHKQVLMIKPKRALCNEANYRELRWFCPWEKEKCIEDFCLPDIIREVTGQSTVPIGDCVLSTRDTCIGHEICEELWSPVSSHIDLSCDGCEIIINSSGSHHSFEKSDLRCDIVKGTTYKCGGIYVMANFIGCDGERVYYDGCSLIAANGSIIAQGPQFSLEEVTVTIATVDLEDVQALRGGRSSRSLRGAKLRAYPRVEVDLSLSQENDVDEISLPVLMPIKFKKYSRTEEIAQAPALWLWDYLRRSSMSGFFLPLNGEVDSSSVACIVYSMCDQVHKAIQSGNMTVLGDLRRITDKENYLPANPKEICQELFTTCCMETANSPSDSRSLARDLAQAIGSYHYTINIHFIINACLTVFSTVTGFVPKILSNGGSNRDNIMALENLKERIVMVMSYLFAQLTLWSRGRNGGLLVLASSNVDEALCGNYTKYGCSSADLNPIGSISKADLCAFLQYAKEEFDIQCLNNISQENTSFRQKSQSSGGVEETETSLTNEEVSLYGKLRLAARCGPVSMFRKLLHFCRNSYSPIEIAQKVRYFFHCYCNNRHKMTTLTPSYHADECSPDDNRHDMRPFLYPPLTWQFRTIDQQVKKLNEKLSSALN